MKVLIVDDEKPARAKLRRLLAAEGLTDVVEAGDGVAALAAVESQRPDLVLLDVQMPGATGLEVAASLPEPAPAIVFVTAYDAHALAAFEVGAVDYLLKPYDAERLARALGRVRERLAGPRTAPVLAPPEKLLVRDGEAVRVVRVADVAWLEAAQNYVVLHTAGARPLLRQTLQGLLDRLGPRFVRTQRSAAVNVEHVIELLPLFKGDYEVKLRDGSLVPCSRQYREAVMAALAGGPGN